MEIEFHTDGSSLGNPGPGGWAWVAGENWASGGLSQTTNNAMELQAIAEALRAAAAAGYKTVTVVSDSKYSIDALTKWIWGWKKRDFRTADGKPVANREVIEEIFALQGRMDVTYRWTKAHVGNPQNERVDDLARRQATAWKNGRGRPAGPGLPPIAA